MKTPLCLWHGDEAPVADGESRQCAECDVQIATQRCATCGLKYFDELYRCARSDPIHGMGQRDPDGHSCDHCRLDNEKMYDEGYGDEDPPSGYWDEYADDGELDDF